MARNETGLKKAPPTDPGFARGVFGRNVNVPGDNEEMNSALERAGRVADFLEFGELLCHDALDRNESCGAHFREDTRRRRRSKRDDEHYCYVSGGNTKASANTPLLHKEPCVSKKCI